MAAALIAIWLWHRYESDPWTRDGHVRADVACVTIDVPGLVTQVAVRDNQMVRKGALLFVVDRPRFAAALEQADANVSAAEATLDQARKETKRDMALGDLVATETHEQNLAKVATASASVDQAIAARDTARLNLARTAVHASVDGQVTNLDLHPGDFLAAGAQSVALIDEDSIRVGGYTLTVPLDLPWSGAVGASLDYPLDLACGVKRGIEAADDQAEAALAARDQVRVAIAATATKSYADVCSANVTLAATRHVLDIQNRALGSVQRLFKGGRGTAFDVTRARSAADRSAAGIPRSLPPVKHRSTRLPL